MLQQLDAANLFLIPLDDVRYGYRDHHLFATLLQHQLARACSAAEIAELHRPRGGRAEAAVTARVTSLTSVCIGFPERFRHSGINGLILSVRRGTVQNHKGELMKTRVTLLLVFAIVLATAPVALANHCKVCRPLHEACSTSLNYGWANCAWDESTGKCVTSNYCGNHVAAATQIAPLASQYAVAAVERLDEPQSVNTTETRVASLETAPTLNH
ncbi:MAG TPA: hypothetical protein VEO54_26405 [Thermoanaerobaculia bacterium]|nr:hypothetical protein [Thermoanaerobaculia bacterium]